VKFLRENKRGAIGATLIGVFTNVKILYLYVSFESISIYICMQICFTIIMNFQQQQLISSRLQLIDKRLEAVVSVSQSVMVGSVIQTFLDEMNISVLDKNYSWKLKTNRLVSGLRYTFTIRESWHRHTANTANVNFDSNNLTFTSSYVNSVTGKNEELIIRRTDLETRELGVRDSLENFLYSCRIYSDLFKIYDDSYTRRS
jgi:hypothetical protein